MDLIINGWRESFNNLLRLSIVFFIFVIKNNSNKTFNDIEKILSKDDHLTSYILYLCISLTDVYI